MKRSAGVFCAIRSLPGRSGIGDLGPVAYDFVDWLAAAGQRFWQVLPITLPDHVGSPYASLSSLAGNWRLISFEHMVARGLLPHHPVLKQRYGHQPIQHKKLTRQKRSELFEAFEWFEAKGRPTDRRAFARWVKAEGEWLANYSLYAALKQTFRNHRWYEWPKAYHTPARAMKVVTPKILHRQKFYAYMQWVFFMQWQDLKTYAHKQGIQIMGDLPFYPPLESVEVWSHRRHFMISKDHTRKYVAGVPPDIFSSTGQKWGNPVYRWPTHQHEGFAWWLQRIRESLKHYDILRIDHFRGYDHTWWIPIRAKDGRSGHWVNTPSNAILQRIKRRWPKLPFMVEDLGLYSPNAERLRQQYGLNGMRVFLFGWVWMHNNIHHPTAVQPDFHYYTSTHDTNTVMGWWRDEATHKQRQRIKDYFGSTSRLNWRCIEAVYKSQAGVAMVSIQDVLGLGSSARLNRPGTIRGNWSWRVPKHQLTRRLAKQLGRMVERYADPKSPH